VLQSEFSRANRAAWSFGAYEAWCNGYGYPGDAAAKIKRNPAHVLREYREYLGDMRGRIIANLLGSHGRRAVALALLGAEVTVVDISDENRRYALEVAQSAGVSIQYIVSDLLEWRTEPFSEHFDLVLMELGILHYFADLRPFARLVYGILKVGGRMILHEFHPIVKKGVPTLDNGRLYLCGDYFSRNIVQVPAPFMVQKDGQASSPLCRIRYWELGEAVTAFSSSGFVIETLVERPHQGYPTLPGTFTLVGSKTS
jgi:SAM-dependent methyltransferase